MSEPQTIAINGRHYDALTGKVIKSSDSNSDAKNRLHNSSKKAKSIDGFIRAVPHDKSSIKSTKLNLSTRLNRSTHSIAPNAKRVTEHSKTLMRNAVTKPRIKKHAKPKTHQITHQIQQPKAARQRVEHLINRGLVAANPAKVKITERANAIKKSELIGKFSELATPANPPITPDPTTIQTTANSEVHLKNLEQLAKIETDPESEDEFTQAALNISDSHHSSAIKEKRFYEKIADKLNISVLTLAIASACLLVIVVGIVLLSLFMPQIDIYLANNKTGIHGVLPSYKPSGFSIKKISYTTSASGSGSITISYQSNSDTRSYKISEVASTWDNQALLQSVVTPDVGSNFKSFSSNGRLIYDYNGNNTAVWIGPNVYFNLTNNANLTPNQILQIANST